MLRQEVELYRHAYREYFDRNAKRKQGDCAALDGTPRVIVLPGVGLFAAGETRRDARIAADIAEHTVRTQIRASMIGHYEGISEAELFDMRSDRSQTSNQYDQVAPLVIDALDASVEGWKLFAEGAAIEGGDAEISREECEKLRVLGYVESCE